MTDGTGAMVVGAQLSLLSSQRAVVATARSDAQGAFQFQAVPPGSYELVASHSDFADKRLPVTVSRGEPVQITVVMTVAGVESSVTVSAEAGQVQGVGRVPQQVNVVGERDLQQRATAVLAEIAEEEVGLSMQKTSPTIGAVLVRGLTEVAVYVDGVRYTTATQRGGINTFFNLNEPSSLSSVEVLRGPNSAQYGSDSLGGAVQLISRHPAVGSVPPATHGEMSTFFSSADLSFGANTLLTYSTQRLGLLTNLAGRRVNTLRPAGGVDSHAAVTRFLGLPSSIFGPRLSDTAFTQYGGTLQMHYAPQPRHFLTARYQRSQQDGGKRYDQLLGGDGNLVADLRNLMLDFVYVRYQRQGLGWFDHASATVSFNSQREERVNQGGLGNPGAPIIRDKERTSVWGASLFAAKQLAGGHNLLIGGDLYRDSVSAPSFSFDPVSRTEVPVRPRVPNGARYLSAGVYAQDGVEIHRDRLRLSGALRYNVASYRADSADSPLVGGMPLFPSDSFRVGDLSGRIGAVAGLAPGVTLAFSYSRGFRAPNITNLGALGLTGVGFQVAASELAGKGAMIGTTAGQDAVSTGRAVQPLKSETSNNYDLALRVRRGTVEMEGAAFLIDYRDTITRQALVLPPGAVGTTLGGHTIINQTPAGAVFVPVSAVPVLVQVNFGATQLKGVEYKAQWRLREAWTLAGNYTFVRAEEDSTGRPPNLGGGGLPPQTAFLRLRYDAARRGHWVEVYSLLAGRQDRLSSLDLVDRRTGAVRSRQDIAAFFHQGARARGLVNSGMDGIFGTADDLLAATGETLAQVQQRVFGSADWAPMFRRIPGYGLVGLRGSFRLGERSSLGWDLANLADKSHRAPGWGLDGPGRSLTLRYSHRF